MIGKGEMIMGIVELFDALEEAKRTAEAASRPVPEPPRSDNGGPSPFDARMI